jgi:hypothetical protein
MKGRKRDDESRNQRKIDTRENEKRKKEMDDRRN